MTYTVGQQILNGSLIVASVDANSLILSVTIPADHDESGTPFTITYNAGVTEDYVANSLRGIG